ncbi:Sulfate/thiosulfate import ATP-binding protein CysA [Acaryochloris thomasi RCC1774]|uniref:Sulfate/thiosulfate import ATP-binding protein CysA n=1 Tax=Acaryochloris thomasi RCC1774 TaxID=1764569 RepID=A0A2W1JB89_9CYAN|nr:ATP-binding cassette domain-containing protein [Acaryochloris thomasi]PZD71353.1 Sulfate/thiosulfate import ATP-binding protein CysA [Acaryochloris thomasi RCC1774]
MPEPLIELRGICQSFDGHVVLNDANLTICPGDAVAILGPSGTGKSTILRIIAGLQVPDAGEVYINGKLREGPVDDIEHTIRMSMVFQQAALFDSLTVSENVGFFLFQNSRLPSSRICQLVNEKLEMVGLPGTGDLYPAQLSGGMRKRVSFARAILDDPDDPADDPQILLYDEPTAGLDPIASTVIEELILELQKTSGCETYAIVTHQHSTIRRTGQRLVLFYNGKVQWEGKAEDLDNPTDPYVRQFLSGEIHGPMEIVDHQF